MVNAVIAFSFTVMLVSWGFIMWEFKTERASMMKRLERKYNVERIQRCRALLEMTGD